MDEGGKYIQTRLTVQYMGLDTKSEFRWQFRNGILGQFRPFFPVQTSVQDLSLDPCSDPSSDQFSEP